MRDGPFYMERLSSLCEARSHFLQVSLIEPMT